MSQLRRQVLAVFKKLHRTKQKVFNEDIDALIFARGQINEDFKKYKHIKDPEKIKELVKYAEDCEHELRTSVVQLVEKSENLYSVRLREDNLLDNLPFNETAIVGPPRKRNQRCSPPTNEGCSGNKPE